MLKGAKSCLGIAAFCKRISCPPAEMLLTYRSGSLSKAAQKKVSTHLAECEFCGAELQLLNKCPPEVEERQTCEIPPHLKRLYEEMINGTRAIDSRPA